MNTTGFAHVGPRGVIFVDTIGSTKRAVMVNALVAVYGIPVLGSYSDKVISNMYEEYVTPDGCTIKEITIQLS